MKERKYDVQVIELRPDDQLLALFDPEYVDVAAANEIFHELRRAFPNRKMTGLWGTDIKILREEDKNAEDNFEKHMQALYEDMQT